MIISECNTIENQMLLHIVNIWHLMMLSVGFMILNLIFLVLLGTGFILFAIQSNVEKKTIL